MSGRKRRAACPIYTAKLQMEIKSRWRSGVDFTSVNEAARANLLPILQRWLPDGKRQGSKYLALNPHRADRRLGSFRINLRTGRWSDFATGDKGGDVVSLAAFLFGLSQVEAARRLAGMLGVSRGSCL